MTFFRSTADLRRWLEQHHATARELWIGFYKKESGRGGITYPEALDQALCFGWIDGVRKRVDEVSYMQRFSPRTARTSWSAINITRATALAAQGLMSPAGLASFAAGRSGKRSDLPRLERFPPPYEKRLRANAKAWRFFTSQPPGYQRIAIRWVMDAAKDETRLRRLAMLIEDSARGSRIGAIPASARSREPNGTRTRA